MEFSAKPSAWRWLIWGGGRPDCAGAVYSASVINAHGRRDHLRNGRQYQVELYKYRRAFYGDRQAVTSSSRHIDLAAAESLYMDLALTRSKPPIR